MKPRDGPQFSIMCRRKIDHGSGDPLHGVLRQRGGGPFHLQLRCMPVMQPGLFRMEPTDLGMIFDGWHKRSPMKTTHVQWAECSARRCLILSCCCGNRTAPTTSDSCQAMCTSQGQRLHDFFLRRRLCADNQHGNSAQLAQFILRVLACLT